MNQLSLDFEPRKHRRPARNGPGTENRKQVYRDTEHTLSGRRAIVFNLIQQAGVDGLTSKEAASILGLSLNSISGRFSELFDAGLIADTGTKRNRSVAWRVK